MQNYEILLSKNDAEKARQPMRVRNRRGSFSYERPRRVRVPSPEYPRLEESRNRNAQIAAVTNARNLQSVMIFILLAAVIGVLWFTIAQLAGDPMATLPSELGTVSVQSGDTLSSIAGKVAPTADRTAMIERIQELNKLSSVVVYPGQLLVVPMG